MRAKVLLTRNLKTGAKRLGGRGYVSMLSGARVQGSGRWLLILAFTSALAWNVQAYGNGISTPCRVSVDDYARSQGSIRHSARGWWR